MLTRWQACRASGEVFQYETRMRRADGQYLWFLHRNVPQWDDQGNIVMWYGASIEIDAASWRILTCDHIELCS